VTRSRDPRSPPPASAQRIVSRGIRLPRPRKPCSAAADRIECAASRPVISSAHHAREHEVYLMRVATLIARGPGKETDKFELGWKSAARFGRFAANRGIDALVRRNGRAPGTSFEGVWSRSALWRPAKIFSGREIATPRRYSLVHKHICRLDRGFGQLSATAHRNRRRKSRPLGGRDDACVCFRSAGAAGCSGRSALSRYAR